MATYVILSRFSPEAFREPHEFKKLAEAVSAKIRSECSGVQWKESFATLGRFDVVDIVEANDPKQIEKAAMIIRAYGHSTTETLVATLWKERGRTLPGRGGRLGLRGAQPWHLSEPGHRFWRIFRDCRSGRSGSKTRCGRHRVGGAVRFK